MRRHLLAALAACGLAAPVSLPAQTTADRWLEVLESNPVNAEALARLLENLPADQWPEIERRIEALPSPAARLALADLRLRAGGNASAALEGLDPSALDADGLLRLGGLWRSLGQPARAREAWEAAAARQPGEPALLARLAAACLAAGDTQSAADYYKLLAKNGEPTARLEGLERLAELHASRGELVEAWEAAAGALEMLGASHWKFPELAARALDWAEAAGRLEEAAERWSGTDSASLRRRAALEMRRRNFDAAAQAMRALCERLPAEPALLAELGAAELAAGRAEAAAQALRKALDLDPSSARAFALAEALAMAGREEEAGEVILESGARPEAQAAQLRALGLEGALEKSLRASATTPEGRRVLAIYLLDRGREAEARPLLEAMPALEAARLLKSSLRLAGAETFARRAMETGDAEAVLLLADIFEARGAPAVPDLSRAAESNPSPAIERRLLEAIQREEGDEAAAKARLRAESRRRIEAARASPAPEAWLRAARWLAAMNENPSQVLEEAARAFPSSSEIWRELAAARETHGDPDGALAALEAARKIEPTTSLDREIARVEKLRGNFEAASAILLNLARENPSDFTLARDVAEAREAEANAFAALEWWEKAFALAPPEERAPLIAPTLACFSRLGLAPRALNFLENAGPRMPEGYPRREWARAAAAFARDHGMIEEWTRRCQMRAADSPAAKLALSEFGEISQDVENENITKKLERAEAERDWPLAAALARSQASRSGASLEDHLRLARLLEKSGDWLAAAAQWRFIADRYNRSQAALIEAAGFFDRALDGPAAREARKRAARLGPLPPAEALAAARELPPIEAARLLAELARRLPDDPARGRLPKPLRLEKLPAPEPLPREKALRELGRLRQLEAKRLAEVAGEGTTGLVWALSAARLPCAEAAFPFATKFPDEFAALALEEQAYPLLLEWINSDWPPSERWQRVVAAAGPLLANGWMPDPAKLLDFFKKAPAFAQRDFAEAAAATGQYRLAVGMGVSEGLPTGEENQARLHLARWLFHLPEVDAGLAVLGGMAPPDSNSLDDPFFEGIRLRSLLLHPQLPGIPDSPAASALAAALAQNRPAFREAARRWLPAIQPTREAGILESWQMHEAAEDLLAIAWETSANRQFLDSLAMLRLSRARPEQAGFLAHQWLALGPKPEVVLASAARASGMGNQAAASAVLEALVVWHPLMEGAWGHLAALDAPLSDRARQVLAASAPLLPAPLKSSLSRRLPKDAGEEFLKGQDDEESFGQTSELGKRPPSPDLAAFPKNARDIEEFLASQPSEEKVLGMARRLAEERPLLVKELEPGLAARFFPRPLNPRFLREEIRWAGLRNEWEKIEEDWTSRAHRGDRMGWEGLVLAALAQRTNLQPAIENFLAHAEPSPGTLAALATELLKVRQDEAARLVLKKLEDFGYPSASLLVAAARLEPSPPRKNDLLETLGRLARVDGEIRKELARFLEETGDWARLQKLRSCPCQPKENDPGNVPRGTSGGP